MPPVNALHKASKNIRRFKPNLLVSRLSLQAFSESLNTPLVRISFLTHILLTLSALLICTLLFEWSSLDLWIQMPLYDFQGHHWWLDRNDQLIRWLFYDGIKVAFGVFVLCLLALWLYSFKLRDAHFFRQKLMVVILSCLIVPLSVNGLKASTHVPCPKNLEIFEGQYPHKTLLTDYPAEFSHRTDIRCFPAGHASGAFALLSLFFLFHHRKKRWQALGFALILGWMVGVYKMVIGDHFFTHTLTSMVWAWLCIVLIHQVVRYFPSLRNTFLRPFQ